MSPNLDFRVYDDGMLTILLTFIMLFFANVKQRFNWKYCYDSGLSHNNLALAVIL